MAAEGKKKNYTLEVIAVIVLIYWLWTGYNKRKLSTISPPVTKPTIDPEVDNCNVDPFKCNPVPCEEFIYKPLAPFDIQRGGTLNIPKGTCFRGDGSVYADSPNGYGSDYAEQQAQEYSDTKQAEAIQNINKKTITFRLINSTAVKETVQILDTTQDSVPFDPVPAPTPVIDFVTDTDGNIYHWVTIGTQQWLVENLKTTKYADGTPIPNLTLDADWNAENGSGGHDGASCWYNNDIANKTPYGALYNWYAVDNAHGLAPTGWRVPSETDFNTLILALGGNAIAGGKLKEVGLSHWNDPNTGATNEVGFNLIGAGSRLGEGTFVQINEYGELVCSNENSSTEAIIMDVIHLGINIGWGYHSTKNYGFTVRCMRDI